MGTLGTESHLNKESNANNWSENIIALGKQSTTYMHYCINLLNSRPSYITLDFQFQNKEMPGLIARSYSYSS